MNGDPLRLRQDPRRSRALRDALSSRGAPVDYDAASGEARLVAAIAGLAIVKPAPSANGAAATATGVNAGAATLVGSAIAVVAMLAAVALPQPATTPARASAPARIEVIAPARSTAAPPEAAPSAEPDAVVAPSPADTEPPRSRAARTIAPTAPIAPTDSADALEEELRAVLELRRESDPARALVLIDAQRARFPRGRFAEEREALAVLALVRVGRGADAREQGGAFLAAHPRSAFASRIREALGLPAASPAASESAATIR